MKKQTQQTPLNPCPKGPSTAAAIIVICAVAAASTGLFLGVPKLAKNYRNRPVTCHECDHIVARPSTTKKKRFKHAFGQDDKYTTLFFCKQHPPMWDYAVGSDAEEYYFKTQLDRQVSRAGLEVTNITWFGFSIYFSTNELEAPTIEQGGFRTNIGGNVHSKHINH